MKRPNQKKAIPETEKLISAASDDPSRREIGRLLRATAERATRGDLSAYNTLWMTFSALSRQVAALVGEGQSAPHAELVTVMCRCQKIVKLGLDRNQEAALSVAFSETKQGCALLREAAERAPEFVSSFAKTVPYWPAMLAQKPIYHEEANKYLRRIAVGTESIPRTAPNTSVELTEFWTALIARLLDDLHFYRDLLSQNRDCSDAGGNLLGRIKKDFFDAASKDYPEAADLRAFKQESQKAWWAVIKKMLLKYWEETPDSMAAALTRIGAVPNKATEATGRPLKAGAGWVWPNRAHPEKTPLNYALQRAQAALKTLATQA
jgi:hypothetical protein